MAKCAIEPTQSHFPLALTKIYILNRCFQNLIVYEVMNILFTKNGTVKGSADWFPFHRVKLSTNWTVPGIGIG